MVNFMCAFDWVTGCSDIWLNIILDVFVRVFMDKFNTWIHRVKEIALHTVGGPHPVFWKHE